MKTRRLSLKLMFTILGVALLFAVAAFSVSAADKSFTASYEVWSEDDGWDEVTKTLTIEKSAAKFDYNGKVQKPTIRIYTVEGGKRVYLPSDQYTIYFEDDCTSPGTQEFNVYSNSKCKYDFDEYDSYEITFDKKAVTVASIPKYTYCGEYIEPKPVVKYKSVTLKSGTDFDYDYDDNYDAGTAKVYIELSYRLVDDRSVITKTFTIAKVPAASIKVTGLSTCDYTGYEITQYPTVKYKSTNLYEYEDYTVKYSNNKLPGTAKVTFTFTGNYTGKLEKTFKIQVAKVTNISKSPTDKSISFYFGYSNCDYYQLYRYSSAKKSYKYIGKTGDYYDSIEDKGLAQYTKYNYKVRAVVKNGSKLYYSPFKEFSAKTKLSSPTVKLTIKNKSITAEWSKNSKADGYILYKYNNETGGTKKLGTFGSKTFKFTDTKAKNYVDYDYYVIATKKVNGKTSKSYRNYSNGGSTLNPANIVRGATLKSKTSYKCYNIQGSKTTLYQTVYLSKSDINTLKTFAKNHFTSKMSTLDKVRVTHQWIHKNVTYATGNLWNKIVGKSYIDAIFNNKLGQCAQYNGALAGMMTYLGYDVTLYLGHRVGYYSGTKMQHFWTEVKINGLTYVMETGNEKRNGSWSYFFTPYRYTSGYTKNGKLISGR